jgi:hypothetical protein
MRLYCDRISGVLSLEWPARGGQVEQTVKALTGEIVQLRFVEGGVPVLLPNATAIAVSVRAAKGAALLAEVTSFTAPETAAGGFYEGRMSLATTAVQDLLDASPTKNTFNAVAAVSWTIPAAEEPEESDDLVLQLQRKVGSTDAEDPLVLITPWEWLKLRAPEANGFTHDDVAQELAVVAGNGSGDVVGPASATDNAIARFNQTTGKLVQNSGITIADGASGTLSGTNSGDVTLAGAPDYLTLSGQAITLGQIDLTTDVTGVLPIANIASGTPDGTKFVRDDGTLAVPPGGGSSTPSAHAASHAAAGSDPLTLSQSQITNLTSDLAGKAAASHTHAIADTTGLQAALADKADLELSNIASAPTARNNLGLGAGATMNIASQVAAEAGTETTTIMTPLRVAQAIAVLGGGGGSTDWGDIGGTLSDQTDLQTALNNKQPLASALTTLSSATAAGLALMDDADNTAQRTTLGLGNASTLNVGTSAGTVAAGDDARFSDARTPTAHAASHVTGGSDAIQSATASQNGLATSTQITKLDGIETLADVTDAANVGGAIHGATAKTTPVDADTVPLIDSAASNVLKKVTWANIKATLNSYLATLYQPLAATLSTLSTGFGGIFIGSGLVRWTGTTYALQTSPISAGAGGTGQGTYAVGNILYASDGGTLSKLAGNTSTTKKFLSQTGIGLDSAAPVWEALPVELQLACSDEGTALTSGTAKLTFRMPHAMTLTAVRASVGTAPTGSTLVVDINEGGVSILGTKLSIDATEKTSTTAASAATITDSALADDAEITIDIDQIGSTIAGAGLKITLIGTRA